jgi:hypothetical protein
MTFLSNTFLILQLKPYIDIINIMNVLPSPIRRLNQWKYLNTIKRPYVWNNTHFIILSSYRQKINLMFFDSLRKWLLQVINKGTG